MAFIALTTRRAGISAHDDNGSRKEWHAWQKSCIAPMCSAGNNVREEEIDMKRGARNRRQ